MLANTTGNLSELCESALNSPAITQLMCSLMSLSLMMTFPNSIYFFFNSPHFAVSPHIITPTVLAAYNSKVTLKSLPWLQTSKSESPFESILPLMLQIKLETDISCYLLLVSVIMWKINMDFIMNEM